MSPSRRRDATPGLPPQPQPGWTAAPSDAERTLRLIQGLLADPAADAEAVLAQVRAVLTAAGYPTDVLGGLDAETAAALFRR